MTNDNKELLQIMLSEFSKVNHRIDKIDSRLDKVESRLDKVDARLDKIENRLNSIEIKQNKTASKLDALQIDVMLAERNIRLDIHLLKDASETIEQVLKIHKLVPT